MSDRVRRAEDEAVKRGHVIVRPSASELFVDIDTPEQLGRFKRGLTFLQEEHILGPWRVVDSPSGKDGHKHGYVALTRDVFDEYERCLLQAVLGSDLTREALSWQQLQQGEKNPTVFFELPKIKQTPIEPKDELEF